MATLIREETITARKHYRCMACAILIDADNSLYGRLTFAERRAVVAARQNKFRIMPGQQYYHQTNSDDGGRIYSWRAIPAIYQIVKRLDWIVDED